VIAAIVLAASTAMPTPSAPVSLAVTIETADVSRFYKLYTATGGQPTSDQVQHEYLGPGQTDYTAF
jgi:hypothetical protein